MRLNPSVTLSLPMLLPMALLVACGEEPAASDGGRSATGEVLEGTISDAMLPLATATSQPPLLPPEQQEDGGEEPPVAAVAPGQPASAEEGAPPPAPEIAAEPAEAPEPAGE
jgi:hypothetical protein